MARKKRDTATVAVEVTPPKRARRSKKKEPGPTIEVRRMHRRDLNRVWDFLKVAFRGVNLETVEYQRPRSKQRFEEVYDDEGTEQLLFQVDGDIVAYAEVSYEVTGSDNWINPRYFEKRDMRPLFVDELAVHPDWNGRGVGSFCLEQLHHLARVRGLTHLVLEVAENNENALQWYKKRGFRKLDAAIFMAASVDVEPELLPPRELPAAPPRAETETPEPPDGDSERRASTDDDEPAGK
jgi:ribosomal protein S18 acetylase RimI-like enzyme